MLKYCEGFYGIENWQELTPRELGLLVEGKQEAEKRHINLIQVAVANGYASARKGKWIPPFKKERQMKQISVDEKKKLSQDLLQEFGGALSGR